MDYIVTRASSEEELKHYGVPGMKWGVRKDRNEYSQALSRAKSTYKSNRKKIDAGYSKAADLYDKKTKGSAVRNKKAEQSFEKAADKWAADVKSAKINYKNAKTSIKKQSVKQYSKKFDEAERASNAADKKWAEVSEQRKALGKTGLTRTINAARGKSDAAKAYNKGYDAWEKMQNTADKKWSEAKQAYANTGRNRAERILNNVKYGR